MFRLSSWVVLVSLSSCTVQLTDNTITVSGLVYSEEMGVVSGATASAFDKSTTTDSEGAFELTVKPADDRVVIEVNAEGFAPARSVVTRRGEVFHYHADIQLFAPTRRTMPSNGGMGSFTVTAGGQTVGVEVPEGSLPAGTTLEVTAFPAENGPGTMETSEGRDRLLQTGGMLYLRAVDSAGKTVPFGGSGVQITPADMPDIGETGQTQSYALDNRAVWTPQTMNSNVTGKTLSAREAGFWNCDRNFRTTCIRGVLRASNKRCGGEKVRAGDSSSPMGLFSQDTSGANGEFCVEGPARSTRRLSIGSTTRSVTFPSTPGSCRTDLAACEDLGEVEVKDSDCPMSCDADEIDTPTGCQPASSQNTGGGGGSTGGSRNAAGFTCLTSQQCTPWNDGERCRWRSCACADAAGGASCVRAWYETSSGRVFACGACTTTCTSAAEALIASCN